MSKRYSDQAAKWDKLVKKQTGVTRHKPQAVVKGMPVERFLGSPEIVCERWIHVPSHIPKVKGDNYHVSILRFRFQTADGQIWTTLQARTFDLDRMFAIRLSGFWNVETERNVNLV